MDFKKKNKLKIPKLDRFIKQISDFEDIKLDNIPNSKGSIFILNLINRFKTNKLFTIENDYKRLNYILDIIIPDFKSYIVTNQNKFMLKENYFINILKSPTSISSPQLTLFSYEGNYFKYLPLGVDAFEAWENVKPISMMNHNATEFTTDLSSGVFSFSWLIPDFTIFLIDIVILLMQYSKFIILKQSGNDSYYSKEYCIKPMIQDMKNIWLMNFIFETIDLAASNGASYYDDDIYAQIKEEFISLNMTKYNFLKTELKSAVNDIIKITLECMIGKIEPERVLNSIPLVGYNSILDYIKYNNDKYYIQQNETNMWVIFLKDIHFVKLLLTIFGLYPNYSKTKELMVIFKPIILRYQRNHFWDRIRDPILKDYVKNQFKILIAIIENIKTKNK